MGNPERHRLAPGVVRPERRGARLGLLMAVLLGLTSVQLLVMLERAPAPAAASPELERAELDPWAAARPHCNALELAQARRTAGLDNAHRAICAAIAGDLSIARAELAALPPGSRTRALDELWGLALAAAHVGDPAAAGPIMNMVAELWRQDAPRHTRIAP